MSRYRLNMGQLRQIKQGIDMMQTVSAKVLLSVMGCKDMAEALHAFRSVNVAMLDKCEVDVQEFSTGDFQTIRKVLDAVEMNINSIRAELDGYEAESSVPKYHGTIWETEPPEGSLRGEMPLETKNPEAIYEDSAEVDPVDAKELLELMEHPAT